MFVMFAYVCCEEPAKICESGEKYKYIGISCMWLIWKVSDQSGLFMVLQFMFMVIQGNVSVKIQCIQFTPKVFFSNSSIRNFGLYAIAV